MDFIIQLIIEGLGYFVGDAIYDKEESKNYSPKAKLIIMIIFTIIYGAFAIVFISGFVYMCNILAKLLVVAVGTGFLIAIAVGWKKTIKAFKEKKLYRL